MKQILEKLLAHQPLTETEAYRTLNGIAERRYAEAQVAAMLTVYAMRPITVDELIGLRRALIERATDIDLSAYQPIDIVGTGGDGKNTFNISTCACFVVAGAGYKVAKHGNHAATSVSGASTVLERHGAKFTADPDRLRHSIEASGVAYLHAPLFHPALGAVGPLRRALGFKTVFNLLGPLVNPAHPAYQLLGVANLGQLRLYTQTLSRLGIGFAVVNSTDGCDEVSLTADFKVATNTYERLYSPADIGLQRAELSDIYGGDTPEEASAIFDAVIDGTATAAQHNCVVATAATAIHAICPEKDFSTCLAEADEALASGRAKEALTRFLAINN